MRRHSRGGIGVERRCTPCAPAARATSTRSFTTTFGAKRECSLREFEQIARGKLFVAHVDHVYSSVYGQFSINDGVEDQTGSQYCSPAQDLHKTRPFCTISRRKAILSAHFSHTIRPALYPGISSGPSGTRTHCTVNRLVLRHLAIREHLRFVLVLDVRVQLFCSFFRGILRGNAHRAVLLKIAERRGHLAEVSKLEGTFAQAAAGDDGDRVGGAAVDLDKGDQPLSVRAGGVFDAEQFHAVDRQAQARGSGLRRCGRAPFPRVVRTRRKFSQHPKSSRWKLDHPVLIIAVRAEVLRTSTSSPSANSRRTLSAVSTARLSFTGI